VPAVRTAAHERGVIGRSGRSFALRLLLRDDAIVGHVAVTLVAVAGSARHIIGGGNTALSGPHA
jgi:hypothetical protein